MIIKEIITRERHIVYDGVAGKERLLDLLSTKMEDIMQATITRFSRRLYKDATKSNSLLYWLMGEESPFAIQQYQDQSIELDMIHEWMTEDRIYKG